MQLPPDLGERLVEALHGVHGAHDGARAAHAKGSCCIATFTASSEASGYTRAQHMTGAPVPALVRFSNGSGIPAYPDYARSDGRGMAVRLELPGGGHTDMVALTLPVFFVRNAEDFIEFLAATRPDPATRQPDLARIGAFLERHPETQAALGAAMAPDLPASYLAARYNGIHAFGLVNAAGETRWARYHWEPVAGVGWTSPEDARAGGRDYLQDDLRRRLGEGSAVFRLVFTLAQEGDPLLDPTAAWPAERQTLTAGTLEVTGMAPEGACDAVVFDPTNVVDGIECPDDPILHARSVAYARSFALRRGIQPPREAASGWPAGAGARAREVAGELAAGEMRAVDVDGTRVAVARLGDRMVAFQDACTHRGCSLADGSLQDGSVTCPCHGSVFELATGAVLRGPARDPIRILD